MERLVYTASNGEKVSLEGHMFWSGIAEKVRSHEWNYTLENKNAYGLVMLASERDLDYTADYETANRLRNLADRDISYGSPGIISLDNWKQRCYIVGNSVSEVHSERIQGTIRLLLLDGFWHKTNSKVFYGGATAPVGIDYPYDYDYDYGFYAGNNSLTVDASIPAPCKITFFGATTDPYISIGGNRYELDVSVVDGAQGVIDGTGSRPTAYILDSLGNRQNVFAQAVRDGGINGGSYAFKPLDPGLSNVSWGATFTVEVEWEERESEPIWKL